MNNIHIDKLPNYWKQVIEKWVDVLNSPHRGKIVITRPYKGPFLVSKDDIKYKALKYYNKRKSDFILSLQSTKGEQILYSKHLRKLNLDFAKCKNTNSIKISIRKNELIYNKDFKFGSTIKTKYKKLYREKESVWLEDDSLHSIQFDLKELDYKEGTGRIELFRNGHEILACVLGKAYFCEFLYDNIQEKPKDKNNDLVGFDTKLDEGQIKKLFNELIEEGFIAKDSDISSFIFALTNKNNPKEFKPILWVKKSTLSKQLNKKSLIDLLNLIGVIIIDSNFRKQVNKLFAKLNSEKKPVSINIQSNNMVLEKSKIQPSQYYEDIKNILSKI